MKKVLTSLIIIMMFICIAGSSYAIGVDVTPKIELNLDESMNTTEEEKTLTLTLSLGKFVGIEEDAIIGYEAVLEYDKEIFESVTVKGLNGWTVNYMESTNRIVGDPIVGKENTDITEITFTLKEGVKPGQTTIKLSDILLTDDINDFKYDKEVTVTIEEKVEEKPSNPSDEEKPSEIPEDKPGESTEDTEKKEQDNVNTITTPGEKQDATIADKNLPKTGMEYVISIVGAIIVIGIISYARYKSIEIK